MHTHTHTHTQQFYNAFISLFSSRRSAVAEYIAQMTETFYPPFHTERPLDFTSCALLMTYHGRSPEFLARADALFRVALAEGCVIWGPDHFRLAAAAEGWAMCRRLRQRLAFAATATAVGKPGGCGSGGGGAD